MRPRLDRPLILVGRGSILVVAYDGPVSLVECLREGFAKQVRALEDAGALVGGVLHEFLVRHDVGCALLGAEPGYCNCASGREGAWRAH